MISNYTPRALLRDTIEELTLLNTISMPILCESAYEQTSSESEFDPVPIEIYNAMQRKFATIFSKLSAEQPSTTKTNAKYYVKNDTIFNTPMVYDELLEQSQCDIYNNIAKLLDFQPLDQECLHTHILNLLALKRIDLFKLRPLTSDDDLHSYHDIIPPRNTGVSFIEYILLLNIYLTTRGRSLGVLNRPVNPSNKKDRQRVENSIKAITTSMQSSQCMLSYIRTFFYFYLNKISDHYEYFSQKCVDRIASTLPEKYRTRKDKFRVIDTVLKNANKNCFNTISFADIIPSSLISYSSECFETEYFGFAILLSEALLRSMYINPDKVDTGILSADTITSEIQNTMDDLAYHTFKMGNKDMSHLGKDSCIEILDIPSNIQSLYPTAIQHAKLINTFITTSINAAQQLLTCISNPDYN